jgi:hypothetical protein
MICSLRSSAAIRGAGLCSAESTLFFNFNVITGDFELVFFQPPLFFQSSSRNAPRATLVCKYALTYHSRAQSGKLNFQVIVFRASRQAGMSRCDDKETMEKWGGLMVFEK